VHRLFALFARVLDAILPTPPSDADYADGEAEAARRRRRLRFRRYQKEGHGGNR
jgi:hypothetical protein